jgi:hypothetical protein
MSKIILVDITLLLPCSASCSSWSKPICILTIFFTTYPDTSILHHFPMFLIRNQNDMTNLQSNISRLDLASPGSHTEVFEDDLSPVNKRLGLRIYLDVGELDVLI